MGPSAVKKTNKKKQHKKRLNADTKNFSSRVEKKMCPLLKTGRKPETKRKSQIESESPRRLFFTFVVVVIVQPADTGDRQGALCVVMLSRKSIGSYSNL